MQEWALPPYDMPMSQSPGTGGPLATGMSWAYSFASEPLPFLARVRNRKRARSQWIIFRGCSSGFSYKKHSLAGRTKATRSRHCWVTTEIIITPEDVSPIHTLPLCAGIYSIQEGPGERAFRISVLIGGASFGACPFRVLLLIHSLT